MKIAIVGTGYVGLVTGACLAELGHEVWCIDRDAARVGSLQQKGRAPFYEPGLDELIARNRERLVFVTDGYGWPAKVDVVFLCVGTPMGQDGAADLGALESACEWLRRRLEGERGDKVWPVVATKSTVPPGTWRLVEGWLHGCPVASCPEFLREGRAVDDFMRPDRVVIGSHYPEAREKLRAIFDPITRGVAGMHVVDPTSAELAKYAANGLLFTRIALMNEIARIADATGADVDAVRQIVGADTRIGPKYLFPGPGAGGSCFRKDAAALAKFECSVVEAALASDDAQRIYASRLVERALGDRARGRVALWGAAFKPGTDDVREAPAIDIARRLLERGHEVVVYDPVARAAMVRELPDVRLALDVVQSARDADALVLVTEWPEFKTVDWPEIFGVMRTPAVVDLRNLWDPAEVRRHGFTYTGLGRGE